MALHQYHTNVHKTLKTKKLVRGDLDNFIVRYRNRRETERLRRFAYQQFSTRDKLNLDIFWLKDHSLPTALDHLRTIATHLRD